MEDIQREKKISLFINDVKLNKVAVYLLDKLYGDTFKEFLDFEKTFMEKDMNENVLKLFNNINSELGTFDQVLLRILSEKYPEVINYTKDYISFLKSCENFISYDETTTKLYENSLGSIPHLFHAIFNQIHKKY